MFEIIIKEIKTITKTVDNYPLHPQKTEEQVEETREIYRQSVDNLVLTDVVKAVNGICEWHHTTMTQVDNQAK